ncbi:MAG TPA: histidinol-phosphate transaminase [Candidatus Peribacteria bacterium]|nr:histidinol-phosphate transaminase [Candidatus Peribacteria bacterium]
MKGYIPPQELVQANIRLDTNEAPYTLLGGAVEPAALNLYKTKARDELLQALAAKHGVHEDEILLGAGSSQLLDSAISAFGNSGVAAPTPTYGQYRHLAAKYRAPYADVATNNDFRLDPIAFGQLGHDETLKILCNPNNPTGLPETAETIDRIARSSNGKTLVDEAYFEFAEPNISSAVELTDDREILVILRTFSKAYGAAGLRLGYAISSVSNIQALRANTPLYPTGDLQHQGGLKLLQQTAAMRTAVGELIAQRETMKDEMRKLGCEVVDGHGNFLLVKPPALIQSEGVRARLLDSGIAVRSMSDQPRVSPYFRVTIGSPEQNACFLQYLSDIVQG